MAKISFIGAGSIVFAKTIMMDIMATPELQDSEICLMNRGKPKLDRIKAFADRVVWSSCSTPAAWPPTSTSTRFH